MDDINELPDQFEAPDLTGEQHIRLALCVACLRCANPLDDIPLKDFVESVAQYVLTGDKNRKRSITQK